MAKIEYRKVRKGRVRGKASSGYDVVSSFGLKSLHSYRLTQHHLESGRKSMVKFLSRKGKSYFRVYPDVVVTGKPSEVRMGKGKGSPKHRVAKIRSGTVIVELEGVDEDVAVGALSKFANKLGVKCKVVSNKFGNCYYE